MPTSPEEIIRFANVYRAALRAGLTDDQAFALVKDAYDASKLYDFNLANGSRLKLATQRAHAAMFPNGKCAEDLLAAKERRPSRWGTPEFHRAG